MKKLGKLKPKYDSRTLQLSKYLTDSLPYIPQSGHWPHDSPLGMYMNDSIGDCTVAAALHNENLWSAANKESYSATDAQALAAYSAITGYTPSDPNSDTGAACLDVLNYWNKTGIGGKKIGAFVQVDPSNHSHVMAASTLFGGLYIGINMPVSAQNQNSGWFKTGLIGDGMPGSWGGHCVSIAGYSQNELDVITWGERIWMTWGFWDTYVTEAYAIISNDFVTNPAKAPNGFDMQTLVADLNLLRQ